MTKVSAVKIHHLRWYIAALLFASIVINYLDRQTLSVLAPVLTKELSISPIQYGDILQAFLVAYTVMYLISGVLVDRWGTRLSLSIFVAWWSISNILHLLVKNAFQLGIARFLLGMGEPGNYNAASRAASEWFPPKERAFINGLVNAGSAIGAVISAPLVAWIAIKYGWRFAFAATGALGFVWLVFWLVLYRLPRRHPLITGEELRYITSDSEVGPNAGPPSWRELSKRRDIWALLLARFFSDPVWWFYLFWTPKYLVGQRGFTLAEIGLFGWLPYLASDVGGLLGGYVSGRLIGSRRSPVQARFIPMFVSALVMPASIAIPFIKSPMLALGLICVITFCHMAWKTNLMTITNDIYPVRAVGTISGFVSVGSGLGGIVFMNITGRIVEAFSYKSIFIIMGFLHPVAYLICRLLIPKDASAGSISPLTGDRPATHSVES